MSYLPAIPFDNSYARELEGFYLPWVGSKAPAPKVLRLNRALAGELGLDADVRIEGSPAGGIADSFQRAAGEALTNVARHAEATRASIVMEIQHGMLDVEVRDNGIGLADSERDKLDSFGLIGMQERAQYLGGWLSISSEPGAGTCLTLHIPLEDWAEGWRAVDGERADR